MKIQMQRVMILMRMMKMKTVKRKVKRNQMMTRKVRKKKSQRIQTFPRKIVLLLNIVHQ